MFVGDGALGRRSLPAAPACLRERPTELVGEHDVVAASTPPEVALRRLVAWWHRSAAAANGRPGTARLGDGMRQRRARQRVHERLLTASCKHRPPTQSTDNIRYSNTTVYYGIHKRSECIPVDCGVTNLIHDRRSCVDFTLEVR